MTNVTTPGKGYGFIEYESDVRLCCAVTELILPLGTMVCTCRSGGRGRDDDSVGSHHICGGRSVVLQDACEYAINLFQGKVTMYSRQLRFDYGQRRRTGG